MRERFIRCDVCGAEQRHVLVGPHWERDEMGRYHRYACCTCKAHHKVYENQDVSQQQRANIDEDRSG